MANELTHDEAKAIAADMGLTRLSDEHLEQFARAARAARARRSSLRSETLAGSDEPAHVFRLDWL